MYSRSYEIMQHHAMGGRVERRERGADIWQRCPFPTWDWDTYEYRVMQGRRYWVVESHNQNDAEVCPALFTTLDSAKSFVVESTGRWLMEVREV